MTLNDFLNIVPKIENSSLPGINSQFKMAPEMRKNLGENFDVESRNPRKSAVLALLFPKEDEMHLTFILRKVYKGVHSNQIGFPGGKMEEVDDDFLDTALRETEEEIGVSRANIKVVKQITDVYIPPSNFLVKTFIGYTHTEPSFILQEREVESLIDVPLKSILNHDYVGSKVITTSYAYKIDVPVFTFTEPVLWGATAMMVSEIKDLIIDNL